MTGSIRRMLCEDRTAARVLRVWATQDGVTAGVDCLALAKGSVTSTDEVVSLLHRQGVKHGIDRAAIDSMVAAVNGGRSESSCVAARGTPPEPGRDGALEFLVKPSSEEARYERDPSTGRIDFRETNLVQNVMAGEPVAIEIPPKPGVSGLSVYGREIPAGIGRPASYGVGANARYDKSTGQVIAEVEGRVVWERERVSISQLYHVRGAVDYSVGNIAFVGEVVIDGDVLDGFSVRAGHNLTIGGNLGACKADSEGDLVIRGGVFGKGKARLRAKGRLSARLLNDCQVEATGTIVVEREALNTTLLTNASLRMTGGALAGGSASALGGAEFDTLGSPAGVLTRVVVGSDFNLVRRHSDIEKRAVEVDSSVAKIDSVLGPVLADRRRLARLMERRREEVLKLVEALRALRDERARLATELEELAETSQNGAVRQINVLRMLHPGVLIEIGSIRHRIKRQVPGPVSIIEDRSHGVLRTVEFRELPDAPKTGAPLTS